MPLESAVLLMWKKYSLLSVVGRHIYFQENLRWSLKRRAGQEQGNPGTADGKNVVGRKEGRIVDKRVLGRFKIALGAEFLVFTGGDVVYGMVMVAEKTLQFVYEKAIIQV